MSKSLPNLSSCNKSVRDGKEAHLGALDRMPSPCPVCGKTFQGRFNDGEVETFKHMAKIGNFKGLRGRRRIAMRAEYCSRDLGEKNESV